MKTSKEILKDLERQDAKIKDLNAEADKLTAQLYPFEEVYIKGLKQVDQVKKDHNDKLHEQIGEVHKKERSAKIERYIIINNLKVALLTESKSAVMEVLKKYDSKRYGEKTRDKISEEIKQKTGALNARIGKDVVVTFDNIPGSWNNSALKYYSYDESAENKYPYILQDNVIKAPADLKFNGEYIEDITARAQQIQDNFIKAMEAYEEYKKAREAYNDLTVQGLRDIESHWLNISHLDDIIQRY